MMNENILNASFEQDHYSFSLLASIAKFLMLYLSHLYDLTRFYIFCLTMNIIRYYVIYVDIPFCTDAQ
jgi:hypothetical protein